MGRGRRIVRYSDTIKEIGGRRDVVQFCRMLQEIRTWRAMAVYFEPPIR